MSRQIQRVWQENNTSGHWRIGHDLSKQVYEHHFKKDTDQKSLPVQEKFQQMHFRASNVHKGMNVGHRVCVSLFYHEVCVLRAREACCVHIGHCSRVQCTKNGESSGVQDKGVSEKQKQSGFPKTETLKTNRNTHISPKTQAHALQQVVTELLFEHDVIDFALVVSCWWYLNWLFRSQRSPN